jgi:uncharacterized secreted protein with C-terminal beta-propeller domain
MQNLSLYTLSNDYNQAFEFLNDPDQNLTAAEINDSLANIELDVKDKAINVAKFLRNMEATAEAIKAAEGEMMKRRKALENRATALKEYLKNNMESTGIVKIECPFFKLSIAKNPAALDLFDTSAIPDEYKRTETVTTQHIDKAAIKKAITAGRQVMGARVISGTRLVIK